VEVLGVRHPIVVSGSTDERITAIANRQRGRISRDQMLAAGIKQSAIDRRARSGHLIRKQKGVYAVGHDARTPLAAETEALLACAPHAVLSHHTAARLLKLLPEDDGIDQLVDEVGGVFEGCDDDSPARLRRLRAPAFPAR